MATPGKLGGGARFKALQNILAEKGAKNPGGLAASIGRKKYGQKKMAALASGGKKRAETARQEKAEGPQTARQERAENE